MALVQNFNKDPFYDDYDEDKRFLRILFRPGYAVQARELTQLQTILQKQIARFGKHIFKNGSVVTGGEVSVSTSVVYHKLETTDSNGNPIDVNNFLGKGINFATAVEGGSNIGSIGKVVAVTKQTNTAPPTIFVEYKTAMTLISGSTFITMDDDGYIGRVITTNSTGRSAVAHINEGVYYLDGFFVKVLPQTIILKKYGNNPTCKIGLLYEESIVDENDDTSLLDPALFSSNYQAPGASRYSVKLTLAQRSLTSLDTTKFIELVRVRNGVTILKNQYPLYADLEKTLARRTYDESGNYTVKPFGITLKDHIPEFGETANGSLFTAELSAGKAYVRGYEIETISPTKLDLKRARDTISVTNYDIAADYGNYLVVSNTKGLFDISTMSVVDMHNVKTSSIDTTSSTTYNQTKIGTARVRGIEYSSSLNSSVASTYKHKLYIFDTRFTQSQSISALESFSLVNSATKIVSSADVDLTNKVGNSESGDVFLSDTNFKTLVFRVPQSYVSFGMSDQDYRGRKVFSSQQVVNGTLSGLSAGGPSIKFVGPADGVTPVSDAESLTHYYVVANSSSGTWEFKNGEIIPFTSANGRTITLSSGGNLATLNFNSSNTFYVDIISSVDYNTPTPKSKLLNLANTNFAVHTTPSVTIGSTQIYLSQGQVKISSPNKISGQSDNLYVSDVFKLENEFQDVYGYFNVWDGSAYVKSSFRVIDSKNPSAAVSNSDLSDKTKDITSKYILDDGQKDEYYDHASIRLKPGVSPPQGQILVMFNYFTSTGTGYFSIDSYDNSSLGSTSEERYSKIPTFTSPSTGQVYRLRDCIDFRPTRENATSTAPNFILNGISIPKPGEALESDYSYYIPRIDRIVLNEDGKFEVVEGISSLSPQTPLEPENSMSLYIVRVNPYTFFPSDTQVRFIENKRYTMRDIGKLEKRIENIEYYTALNTLEKAAQDLVVLDDAGLNRFKNGILVDTFRGHQIGDVKNIDYLCSMNFRKGELRPSFISDVVEFGVNTFTTTANVEAGGIILSPYRVVSAIVQNVATNAETVNPFTLQNFSGTLSIYPPGDFWVDTNKRPDVLINLEGENDAWEQIGRGLEDGRRAGWGTSYGEWNEHVSYTTETPFSTTTNRTQGYITYQDVTSGTVSTTYYSRERSGVANYLVPERIVRSIGNRQVDLSVVPYVRSQWLTFLARRLRPNQFHYTFINNDGRKWNRWIEHPMYMRIYDVSGKFNDTYGVNEQVTSSSGGRAKLLLVQNRVWKLNQTVLYLGDVIGTFAPGDTITGTISGATAKADVIFWNNGNVVSGTASSITLGSSSPYQNTYCNLWLSYSQVDWPYSGNSEWRQAAVDRTRFDVIRIVSGKGLGQTRVMTNYNSITRTANVIPTWHTIPDNTSRWTVSRPRTNTEGKMAFRFFLPDHPDWRINTGAISFRISDDANNDPTRISSFAEDNWYAQGLLNTIEDVSVSVRVPTLQSREVYQKEENYRAQETTTSSTTTTVVRDATPIITRPIPYYPPPAYEYNGGGDSGGGFDSTSSATADSSTSSCDASASDGDGTASGDATGDAAGDGDGSASCFLTTAMVKHMGLKDDCKELQTARMLRDEKMTSSKDIRSVDLYYKIAPILVERKKDWNDFYVNAIQPIMKLVEEKRFEEAVKIYKYNTVFLINKYIGYNDKKIVEELFRTSFSKIELPYSIKYLFMKLYFMIKLKRSKWRIDNGILRK